MPPRKQPEPVVEEQESTPVDHALVNIMSETIGDSPEGTLLEIPNGVISAFIAAQSEIGNVAKDAKNTFFKTPAGKPAGYVSLAALNAAVNPILAKHGLAYIEFSRQCNDGIYVIGYIEHTDGSRTPESAYPVVSKDNTDPQKFGAGVTYARRYNKMLVLDIAAEDDDGNTAAQARSSTPRPSSSTDELAAALRGKGYTDREKVAAALKERFPNVATVRDLTSAQINEWVAELTNTDQPNF